MFTTSISASGLLCNPHVDKGRFCHPLGVKSDLQKLFVRRAAEEMTARAISGNELVKIAKRRGHRIVQATVSRILAGKQDPTLEKVNVFADCLGLPAWFLLTEAGQAEQTVIRAPSTNVVKMASPYPKTFNKVEDKVTKSRMKSRKLR